MTAADLIAEAIAIRDLGANVIDATDIGTHAVEAAIRHWRVGPLCKRDPNNPRVILSPNGKDPVGRLVPHGVLDFTNDVDKVIGWWTLAPWNIGARVPESMFVIDIDPRHGGLDSIVELTRDHDPLPQTLMTVSGRGDGGVHYFLRRPPGKLSSTRLGPGIDIKSSSGYVVLAPSIHPDSGRRYVRCDYPVAAPPAWLVDLIVDRPKATLPRSPRSVSTFWHGQSIADSYSATTSWADILQPHGWQCRDAAPDADGSRWLHPTATSACSATVRHGCLFIYSPNTPFDITEASNPNGYTKFRAYALLNHDGDMSAAARALRGMAP